MKETDKNIKRHSWLIFWTIMFIMFLIFKIFIMFIMVTMFIMFILFIMFIQFKGVRGRDKKTVAFAIRLYIKHG